VVSEESVISAGIAAASLESGARNRRGRGLPCRASRGALCRRGLFGPRVSLLARKGSPAGACSWVQKQLSSMSMYSSIAVLLSFYAFNGHVIGLSGIISGEMQPEIGRETEIYGRRGNRNVAWTEGGQSPVGLGYSDSEKAEQALQALNGDRYRDAGRTYTAFRSFKRSSSDFRRSGSLFSSRALRRSRAARSRSPLRKCTVARLV
jgi:hypothetical protein